MSNTPGLDKALANMSRFIDVGRINAIRSNHEQEVAQIRADEFLSREGREMKLAQAVVNSRTKMDSLRAELEAKVAAERHRIERTAFGPTSFDPSDRLATRDAFDRASRLTSSEEANRLIEQAKLTGDDGLARAVVHRAHHRGWVSTVDAWEQHQPGTVGLINELGNLPEDTVAKTTIFRVKAPDELRTSGDPLINRYAAKAKYATREDLEKDEVFTAPDGSLAGQLVDAMGDIPFGTTVSNSPDTTPGE